MTAQLALALPVPPRPQPDFPAEARKELTAALEQARTAIDEAPWDRRRQGYWRIVFPQMAGWLPAEERVPLVAEFMAELERIEPLIGAHT